MRVHTVEYRVVMFVINLGQIKLSQTSESKFIVK